MLLFIYNDFRIDLTHLKVTFTELNPWFQEDLSSEYSFPFEMALDDWKKIADFSNYNAIGSQRNFSGKLYRDGDISDATLKIHEQRGQYVSGIIYAGLDVLTVFDVQLSELPLDNFPVVNLKQHAQTVITKTFPEVNYNFPMVHTDKYDPENEDFHNFEKVLNKYGTGQFIENVLELESNLDQIRNIMQPMPYLMYVVKKGFEYAGFTLQGDIITDPDFKRCLIVKDGEYFNLATKEVIPLRLMVTEYQQEFPINNIAHVFYRKEITVAKKGDYILSGNIYAVQFLGAPLVTASSLTVDIQLSSGSAVSTLFNRFVANDYASARVMTDYDFNIDLNLSLEAGDRIIFTKLEAKRDQEPSITPDYPEACSLDLTPVRYRNPDGSPIISLLDLNQINLAKVVPDMSFLDLLDVLRKWKNYGMVTIGRTVVMNSIRLDRDEAIDISNFDIEEPLRTFSEEKTYELKFADGQDETYKYDSVYIDSNGSYINTYRAKKDTFPITIDALVYPVIERNGVTTAYAFDDETSKLRLVSYRPMPENGAPRCYEAPNLLIPAIFVAYYEQWLNFRINSISYQWEFIISVEKLRQISLQSLIFAYKNYHVLTEMEKERIDAFNWRVTAKSESLQ